MFRAMGAMRAVLGVVGGVLGVGAAIAGTTAFVRGRARKLVRRGKNRAVGLPLNHETGPESLSGYLWQATGDRLIPGNRVTWCFDTGIFDAIHRAFEEATCTIRVAIYIWKPGQPGERMVEACCRAAARGVQVQIVVDPLGSQGFEEELLPRLKAAGCEVRPFRKPGAVSPLRLTGRLHRKLVLVDDRIAFTGGFAFAPDWLHGAEDAPRAWRDTHARIEGPVVVDVLQAFATTWLEAAGQLLELSEGPERPPPVPQDSDGGAPEHPTSPEDAPPEHPADATVARRGSAWAAFVASRESAGWTDSFLLLWLSMVAARSRLWIANAYFAPPAELLELLCHKGRMGVDVRVLLPGPHIDHAVSRWAQRSTYGPLLAAGVRVFEYQPSMMHAKTLLVDDRLSVVGSINLDPLSLYWLEEGSLVVDDPEVNASLARQWARDQARCVEVERAPRLGFLRPPRWTSKRLPRRLAGLLG